MMNIEQLADKQLIERMSKRLQVGDPVNHPSHYNQGGIETLALMKAVMSREAYLGFLQGNMIKYTVRAPFKGSKEIDYDKAKFYKDEYDKEMAG